MTKVMREQLFVREGVDNETARIAAEASYLAPKDRTPDQQQAISKVSKAIAENNRKLADD
jgi:streptomycin 6-kinase